jgi:tetratricopeptide (TPR) repeat protein
MSDKKKIDGGAGIQPARRGGMKPATTTEKTTDRLMNNPQPPKDPRTPQAPRLTVSSRSGAAAKAQAVSAEKQLQNFEAASKLFHARKLPEARELFMEAAAGPERDVAHRAKLHASMCDRRLQQPSVNLRTAEDFYNYGVALLNTRKVEESRANLEKALQLAPDTDHIHYALALVQALAGDVAGAHEHLRRAIELEPRNRIMARQDGDFAALSGHPQFQALLYPEKKNW